MWRNTLNSHILVTHEQRTVRTAENAEAKEKAKSGDLCETTFHVVKQRMGRTGMADVYFRRSTASYEAGFVGAEEPAEAVQ